MLGPCEHHRGVDLIGQHPRVVARRDLGDLTELLAREDATGRVVRIAEDQRPGAIGKRRLDRVDVELAAVA